MNATQPVSFWNLPNLFTFARFALAPVVAGFFLVETHWGVWIAGWTAGAAMFTDFLDGYFARKTGQVSNVGKIFDPLADAAFFIIVWVALGLAGAYPIWFALPFLVREFVQHVYIRPTAARHGVVLSAVFLGKLKTTIQTVVLLVIAACEVGIDYWPVIEPVGRWINIGLISLAGAVSVVSILPYFKALALAKRGAA